MRKDYEYVDKATSICLTCTLEGGKLAERTLNNLPKDGSLELDGTVDLIFAIQDEYYKVRDDVSLKEWYDDYCQQYWEVFEAKTNTTWEEFAKAFVDGLVTIYKVIWD